MKTITTTRRHCTGTRRRQTAPKREPTENDILRTEITAICQQIDRRTGAKPGTAERGVYFWFWPRTDSHANLIALHKDAARFLYELTHTGRITG